MKNNKGITLVALVITIIVLLILAGVSISLVVGDNGIVSRATGASDKTKKAQLKEQMELALSDCQTGFSEAFSNGSEPVVADFMSPKKVSDALKKNGYGLYENADATTAVKAGDNWEDGGSLSTFYIKKDSSKEVLGVQVEVSENTTSGLVGANPKYAKDFGVVDATDNPIEE